MNQDLMAEKQALSKKVDELELYLEKKSKE